MKSKLKNFQTNKEVKILTTQQKSKVRGGKGSYKVTANSNSE